MSYSLGSRSLSNLEGVHPDLAAIVRESINRTEVDFTVIDGLRTIEEQKELVAKGFSKTMNSRHLSGHAVDIIPYPIPRDWSRYKKSQWRTIASVMKEVAKEKGISLEWGGDWRSFKDKPHYQLPKRDYP